MKSKSKTALNTAEGLIANLYSQIKHVNPFGLQGK